MKKITPLAFLILFSACKNESENLLKYVNPLIGTDFTGNTYPGAQAPFGAVQLSPDNGLPGWDRIAGYFYPDSTIAGFSHTHLQGTGAGDLYDVSFLPVTFPLRTAAAPLGVHSRFSHASETATAGYYRVRLADYGIDVELTATERVGVQRYTFEKTDSSAVILNLSKAMNWDFTRNSGVEVVDSQSVTGFRFSSGWAKDQKVFFATHFSKKFKSVELDTNAVFDENQRYIGRGVITKFYFGKMNDGEQITVKTAISSVDENGAKLNLQAEAADFSFDEIKEKTQSAWQKELARVEVKGGSDDDKTKFYTAIYRAFCAPTIFCDADGKYRGADGEIHQSAGVNYSTFSLWDTYRAAHPLYTILQPSRTADMVASLLAHCDEFGRMPVWNFYACETDMMIGYHSVPVAIDAALKGLKVDKNKILQASLKTANLDDYRGIGWYKKLGFVPCDKEGESLSKTVEYAFDDNCIALLAADLGQDSVAKIFQQRAKNYQNLFNPKTNFLQPKLSNGEFLPNFQAKNYTEHITESNGWHYLFAAQHDIDGMLELMGNEIFEQKLDSIFNFSAAENDELPIFSTGMIGQYAHGNEPSHHLAFLYNKISKPWRTQELTQKITAELYRNAPDGLCGNEDCGQMSAWLAFSAVGFYPLDPVSGQYEITAPMFDSISLNLENGKIFKISCKNKSAENRFIQQVFLGGKELKTSFITHEQIVAGGELHLIFGAEKRCWY